MKDKRYAVAGFSIFFLTIIAAILVAAFSHPVQAGTAPYYSTTTSTGTENSAIIEQSTGTITMIAACNYNTAAGETVMLFDATSLPANGAVPRAVLGLTLAASANAPTCGSFSFPRDGVTMNNGAVVAASTTGKTLTVDTQAGGNTFFEIAR